jgi:hypothetical protein
MVNAIACLDDLIGLISDMVDPSEGIIVYSPPGFLFASVHKARTSNDVALR